MPANFPSNPSLNQTYTNLSRTWTWNGRFWQATSTTIGYTGSASTVIGYTGSTGAGYTGSTGVAGYSGSLGYSGSKGESSFTFASTAPSNPTVGDRWYDIVEGAELVWVNDGDSNQWVEVAASGFLGNTGYTGSRGTDGIVGTNGTNGTNGYAGSSGLVSRSTATVTTSSVANAASTTASITGFKGYNLYKVYSSHAAWIRIYTNVAARSSDSSRAQGTDPTPDVGIITEVITSSAGQTVTLAPAVLGFNDESPVTTAVPIAVTNLSGSSATITVTLTLVQTEA